MESPRSHPGAPSPGELRPDDPTRVGRYRIEAKIGEGGMGAVYLGRDADGRQVAVKVVRAELAGDRTFLARFHDEAANAERVASFCTAQVLEHGEDLGLAYMITEYIDGPSLLQHVAEKGALSPGMLHGVAVGVAAALVAIHSAGLVHRDLKPSNVLLSISGPRVIDFGIARALDAASAHTRTGQLVGTPGWIAPEQITSQRVTPAVDLFAWGCLVAFAANGRNPFGQGSFQIMAARAVHAEPELGSLPGTLDGLVRACLRKDPEQRPSARDLLLALVGGGGEAAVNTTLGASWAPPPPSAAPTVLSPGAPAGAPTGPPSPGPVAAPPPAPSPPAPSSGPPSGAPAGAAPVAPPYPGAAPDRAWTPRPAPPNPGQGQGRPGQVTEPPFERRTDPAAGTPLPPPGPPVELPRTVPSGTPLGTPPGVLPGAPSGAPPGVPSGAPAARNRRPVLVAAAAVAVAVLLAAGGAYLFARPEGEKAHNSAAPAGPAAFPADPLLVRIDTEPGWPRSCHGDIGTYKPGAAAPVTLVRGSQCDILPVRSPDGRRVAFTRTGPGSAAALVVNADGSGLTMVTDKLAGGRVTWSPDGTRLAYVGKQGDTPQLYAITLDDHKVTQLTTDGSAKDDPMWSSKGLVFWSRRDGAEQLYTLDPDRPSAPWTRLSRDGVRAVDPAWTRDGSMIAYTRGASTESEIWVMRADGSGAHRVTASSDHDMDPAWSKDGQWICYVRGAVGTPQIRAVRADGTGDRAVSPSGHVLGHPNWS